MIPPYVHSKLSESHPHPSTPVVWSLGACVPLWIVALILRPSALTLLPIGTSAALNVVVGLLQDRANRLGWALGTVAVAVAVLACIAAHEGGVNVA